MLKQQSFRVQKIQSSLKSYTKPEPIKFQLGQIINKITSVSVLNYNSHCLVQIISSIFQNQSGLLPYKQIEKSLSIITYSMETDSILKSELQNLLNKNIHKKDDVYLMFCLWCKYQKIETIINKLFENNKKIKEKLVYIVLMTFITNSNKNLVYYQNMELRNQMSLILNMDCVKGNSLKILEEIDGELVNLNVTSVTKFLFIIDKLVYLVKNCMDKSIANKLQQTLFHFIQKRQNSSYLKELIMNAIFYMPKQNKSHNKSNKKVLLLQNIVEILHSSLSSNQKSLAYLNNILVECLESKVCKNQQFNNLYNILKNIFSSLNSQNSDSLTNIEAEQGMQSSQNLQKLHNFLMKSIKQWFLSVGLPKLWTLFNTHYELYHYRQFSKDSQIQQKRIFIIEFLHSLSKQTQNSQKIVHKLLFSKYLFHYFQSKPFNFKNELRFLKPQATNSLSPSHSQHFIQQRQILSKSLKHIKNENYVNVMIFNKLNFPDLQWESNTENTDKILDKYAFHSDCKKVLNKFIDSIKNIEEQMLKDNKKIQIVYNVIKIKFDKKIIVLTLSQLSQFFKKYTEGKFQELVVSNSQSYQKEYNPTFSQKKQVLTNSSTNNKKMIQSSQPQQIHPIVLQAKIIKLMKKQLKKASAAQISKHLNFPLQKVQQSVKKLVSKGFLEEHEGQLYSYQP